MKRIGVLLFCAGIVAAPLWGWQWPLAELRAIQPGVTLQGFGYRLIPEVGSNVTPQPVAEGTVVLEQHPRDDYRRSWNNGIPYNDPRVVRRHENELWSIMVVPERGEEPVPWVDFAIWDGVSRRQLNPRAILPPLPVRALSGTAFLALLQDGQSISASAVTAGEIVIALTDPASVAPALPWEARILRGGQVVGRQRFVYADQLQPVEIVRTTVPPGITIFNVEYFHFDRVVVRSTLRVVARAAETTTAPAPTGESDGP